LRTKTKWGCYGAGNSVYEHLGHAEVVQLELAGDSQAEMAAFADTYFSQFVKTPFGMMRSVRMRFLNE